MRSVVCKNCLNKFQGTYCNLCGEKITEEADLSLNRIFSQAFESITNLDSKFFKTFHGLLFYPGRLSDKFVSGIRVPYLKPFQVFLLCNVVFFFFLGDTDFFRAHPDTLLFDKANFLGFNVKEKVLSYVEESGFTLEEVKSRYDRTSSDVSKVLLIILIPFYGLFGFLVKSKMAMGKHLIFATHFFSFFLLLTVIITNVHSVLPESSPLFLLLPALGCTILYYAVAAYRFYHKSWYSALFISLMFTLLMLASFAIYSTFITNLSLYIM